MTFPVAIGVGLALLLFPLWKLRGRNLRLAGFEQRGWPSGGRAIFLAVIDPCRAAVGTALLLRNVSQLERLEWLGRWQDPATLAAAVALGLIVQTLAWRDEDFAFAPMLYALGVAAIVAHPLVLGISLPLAIGGSLALRAWAGGFLGAGAGLGLVGLAVEQQDWRVSLLVGVALCMPVLASVLAGRHLGWMKLQGQMAKMRHV
jgi:hypothetical protein